MKYINIKSEGENKEFKIKDIVIDPLIGRVNSISSNIILVSNEDYEWITTKGIDYKISGKLNCYNFSNWKDSEELIKEIDSKLYKKNKVQKEDKFFKTSSKIEAYNTAVRSSKFLIFNIMYVVILLYLASIIIIHFKFKMEYDEEEKRVYSLYRIGISDYEIKEIISKKVLIIFFVPYIYSLVISIIYNYYSNSSYGYGALAIIYSVCILIIFMIVHFIVYKLYLKSYLKNIIYKE